METRRNAIENDQVVSLVCQATGNYDIRFHFYLSGIVDSPVRTPPIPGKEQNKK